MQPHAAQVNALAAQSGERFVNPNYVASSHPANTHFLDLRVEGHEDKFLVDSGAGLSLLKPTKRDTTRLLKITLAPLTVKLHSPNAVPIPRSLRGCERIGLCRDSWF